MRAKIPSNKRTPERNGMKIQIQQQTVFLMGIILYFGNEFFPSSAHPRRPKEQQQIRLHQLQSQLMLQQLQASQALQDRAKRGIQG